MLGMRLDGEKINEIDEGVTETANEMTSVFNSDSLSSTLGFSQQVVVGYALTAKKKQSFLQPKLELIARYIYTYVHYIFSIVYVQFFQI